jgi:hypothetical protein
VGDHQGDRPPAGGLASILKGYYPTALLFWQARVLFGV